MFLQVLQKNFLPYLFKFFFGTTLKKYCNLQGKIWSLKKLVFKLEFVPVCDSTYLINPVSSLTNSLFT